MVRARGTWALVKPASGYSTLSRFESASLWPSTSTGTFCDSGLTDHLGRIFVIAQALVRRRADAAGLSPERVRDLGHKYRLYPAREPAILRRQRVAERRGIPAQRRQPRLQHPQCLLGEPGTDMPGE